MTQSRQALRRRRYFEIGTYVVVLIVLAVSLWASGGTLNPNIDVVILILAAYTLLLVLPIRKFKLTSSGFESISRPSASLVISDMKFGLAYAAGRVACQFLRVITVMLAVITPKNHGINEANNAKVAHSLWTWESLKAPEGEPERPVLTYPNSSSRARQAQIRNTGSRSWISKARVNRSAERASLDLVSYGCLASVQC